jgi:hypothetical protein
MTTWTEAVDPAREPLRALKTRKKKYGKYLTGPEIRWAHWVDVQELVVGLLAVGRNDQAAAIAARVADQMVHEPGDGGWIADQSIALLAAADPTTGAAERIEAAATGGYTRAEVEAALPGMLAGPLGEAFSSFGSYITTLCRQAHSGPNPREAGVLRDELLAAFHSRLEPASKTKKKAAARSKWAFNPKALRAAAAAEPHPVIAERLRALATMVDRYGRGGLQRARLRTVVWMLHAAGSPAARDAAALHRKLASPAKLGDEAEVLEALATWVELTGDAAARAELQTLATARRTGWGAPDKRFDWSFRELRSPFNTGDLDDLARFLSEVAVHLHDGYWKASDLAEFRQGVDEAAALLKASVNAPESAAQADRREAIAAGVGGDPKQKTAPAFLDPAAEPNKRIAALKRPVFKKFRPKSSDCLSDLLAVAVALEVDGRDAASLEVLDVLCGYSFSGDRTLWADIAHGLSLRARLHQEYGRTAAAEDDRFRIAQRPAMSTHPAARPDAVARQVAFIAKVKTEQAWSWVGPGLATTLAYLAFLHDTSDDPAVQADAAAGEADARADLAARL